MGGVGKKVTKTWMLEIFLQGHILCTGGYTLTYSGNVCDG
jgi:hypothetical protein